LRRIVLYIWGLRKARLCDTLDEYEKQMLRAGVWLGTISRAEMASRSAVQAFDRGVRALKPTAPNPSHCKSSQGVS